MPVQFFSADLPIPLRERNRLKVFLHALFRKEGRKIGKLNYIFCSDEYLLDINKTYLRHDYYTDILSFDLSDNAGDVLGEIYISVDRVRENARQVNETVRREIHRVIIHGALHLCGYRDKTKAQQVLMRIKEEEYLKRYGL